MKADQDRACPHEGTDRWDPAEIAVRHLRRIAWFLRDEGPAYWACAAVIAALALWAMLA